MTKSKIVVADHYKEEHDDKANTKETNRVENRTNITHKLSPRSTPMGSWSKIRTKTDMPRPRQK